MGRSFSPTVALQVDTPAEEQQHPAISSGSDRDSTAFDGVFDSRPSTPRASVVGLTAPLRGALRRSFPAHSTDLGMPSSLFVCVHRGLR